MSKRTTKTKPEGSGYPGPDLGLVGDRTGTSMEKKKPAKKKPKPKGER